VHVVLVGFSLVSDSPTVDEIGHLAAGVVSWQRQEFELYSVNPPLVRMIAAMPVILAGPDACPLPYDSGQPRPEFPAGVYFTEENGSRSQWLFSLARWACLPLGLLGAYICWRWGLELHGYGGGLVALTLWCFCPNVLGYEHLITPDAAAAALGVMACYLFWKWLKRPDWSIAFLTGLGLGLAELTKFTWTVLFALWPAIWFIWWHLPPRVEDARHGWRQIAQFVLILLLAIHIINAGYGFEGSFKRLGDYRFVSRTLAGRTISQDELAGTDNRFRETWLGSVRVPLPSNYLLGIDLQKLEFERKKWSYLAGQWRFGGWWYYYLYAIAVKVPLGVWALGLLTLVVAVGMRHYSPGWRDELLPLAPALAVLIVVSSQTGFNHHVRYILPAFPFAFISMSRVGRAFSRCWGFQCLHLREGDAIARSVRVNQAVAVAAAVALAWSVTSSLSVYPHSLSYFNELAGGPKNGHSHLLDSNIDWGQDLFYLERWLDLHGTGLTGLEYFGTYPPEVAGIRACPVPRLRDRQSLRPTLSARFDGPRPGLYAVSVNSLHGHVIGGWSVSSDYTYFQRFKPVAMAGYSIYIYDITLEEANRVRRELGLPELAAKDGK